MNINKISKQFVEQDEEIVFIIEKLLESAGDRVILILPHISALTSSAVSLKILANQILDSKKLVVLVTDNESADKLCQRANLAVRSKISEVDKDAWIEAKNLKLKMAENRERLKKELLGARTPQSDDSSLISDGIVPAKVIDDVDDSLANEIVKPIVERPRIKPKVIDISGIKLVAGGDIAETEELLHLERQRLNAVDDENDYDESNFESEIQSNLVGNDIAASYTNKKRIPRNRVNPLNKISEMSKSIWASILKPGRGRTIGIGVLLLLVGGFAYSYFFLSRVDFTVYLDKETGAIAKSISADADLAQSNIDGQVLKAEMISKTVTQTNEGGQPTGKKQTGTPATGEITIFNLSDSQITLPAGTVVIEKKTGKSLKFKTKSSVTIAAASGVDEASFGKSDIDVEAETFGSDYDMVDLVDYKVGSYSLDEVNAKSFIDFSKSVVQEVTVVSKEDIEAVKASLVDQMKFELNNSLTDLLSNDDILLSGSQVYTEVSFTTSVKEGEEVLTQNDEAPTFKSELKMTITAMKISKAELKSLIEKAALNDKGADNGLKVTITDPVVDNVAINARKATFNIRTNASYTADLDIEKLKDLIKGKSVEEAKEILGRFNGVKEVRSRYTPPFVPFNMQMVSDDKSRFDIVSAPYN